MVATSVSPPCWACGAPAGKSEAPAQQGLWSCGQCGLRFQPDRGEREVRDRYDDTYFEDYVGGGYEEHPRDRSYEAKLRLRYVERFAPRGGDLLEIGVAGGWFMDRARSHGFSVRGVEPAARMAETARRRFGLDIRTAFIEDVALEADSFDLICGWHVLEHIPDPLAVLADLRAALRPGGVLLVEVPNAASVQAAALGRAWHGWQFDVHLGHYTPAALTVLLERAGFDHVECETIHGADYHRPSVALRPGNLGGSVRFALQGNGLPRRAHPTKKELLRAAARRPTGPARHA